METLIVIGWLLLTIIPIVGYLVVSGINAKLDELRKLDRQLTQRRDMYKVQIATPTSKVAKKFFSKRVFGKSHYGKVLRFKKFK